MPPSDAERIISAFAAVRTEDAGIMTDPIENDPKHAQVIKEIDRRLDAEFPEIRMGMCHAIWRRKKQLLAEREIAWFSPSDLNPGTLFD